MIIALLNLALTFGVGNCLYQVIQNAKKRFQEQDEKLKLIQCEILDLHKKWKTKND